MAHNIEDRNGKASIAKRFFILLSLLTLGARAQETITFTGKTVTFTNLEGRVYTNATIVKADLDGLIWRDEASGGRVCYTNLPVTLLVGLGVPTDRIELARLRAEHKDAWLADWKKWQREAAAFQAASEALYQQDRERAREERRREAHEQWLNDMKSIAAAGAARVTVKQTVNGTDVEAKP